MPRSSQQNYRAAYLSTASQRAALPDTDVQTPNIDLITAAGVAILALSGIHQLEPDMGRVLTKEELREVRHIETYALAMHFAQVAFLATSIPVEPIQELGEQASRARDLLSSDASALAKRGLLDERRLLELNNGIGYRNTAVDCQVLVRLFREHWSAIDGKTAVSKKELDEIESVGDRLASAVSLREQSSTVTQAAMKERARAFTLFARAYDHARRAAAFLRWNEDDADTFVPSLYAGRGGRGRAVPATPGPTPPASAVTIPDPAAAGPLSHSAGLASS